MTNPRFNDTPRRVFRDPERGIILGVCAGIAEAIGCPAWLARVVALVIAWHFIAATLVAYAIAALLLPVRPLRYCGPSDEASFWRSGHHGG